MRGKEGRRGKEGGRRGEGGGGREEGGRGGGREGGRGGREGRKEEGGIRQRMKTTERKTILTASSKAHKGETV